MKTSMIMDHNKDNSGRFMSDLGERQGAKQRLCASFHEECRRRGIFLGDGNEGGDGGARCGLVGWLVSMVSRTRL